MENAEKNISMRILKIALYLILCIVLSGCDKKPGSDQLAREFYELNKSRRFDALYNVMLDNRWDSYFDEKLNQHVLLFDHVFVFDADSSKYLRLPLFRIGASPDEKINSFNQCGKSVKAYLNKVLHVRTAGELASEYVKYVDSIRLQYDAIKTPRFHNNANVRIVGDPSLGKFIRFELNDKVSCFYLGERKGLTSYWDDFFSAGRMYDEHWYYSIKP